MFMKSKNSEMGYAVLLVLVIILVLSASIITVSVLLKGQTNISDVSRGTSIGLKEAENAIAVAVSKMKAASNLNVFGDGFRINQDGWTTEVFYDNTTHLLRATARKGRFKRVVSVNVTSNMDTLNEYCAATEGTMNITNLSASLRGNKIYSRQQMRVGYGGSGFSIDGGQQNGRIGALVTGQDHIDISTNGSTSSLGLEKNVHETIPDVDWNQLKAKTPAKILSNPSPAEITNAIATANTYPNNNKNVYIIVETSGANPTVELTSMNYGANVHVTLVVLKDPSITNATPKLLIHNGSIINSTLNAFVQGDIDLSSAITNYGSFYATGRIDFNSTGGTSKFYGGLASKGGMTIQSVDFGSYMHSWDNSDVFIPIITTTNWREEY